MKNRLLLVAATACIASSTAFAQLTFTQVGADVDLTTTSTVGLPEYIGANPSAIAWNGTSLWAAGFNNAGGPSVGITRVDNPTTTPTFTPAFANAAPPLSRGYTGLDISGNRLAASYDSGAADPLGISTYDATTGANLWSFNARGSSGVSYDPDFNGIPTPTGSGVGWLAFGSGRRLLNDTTSGAVIYDTTNGMIVDAGIGSQYRDIDFDPTNGDFYARVRNEVVRAPRTGANTNGGPTVIAVNTPMDGINGQNLAFMNTAFGKYVIYNDRSMSAAGQNFFSVVKIVDPSGNVVTSSWGTFAPPTGAAYYDFSFDAGSGTLAVLDFTGRRAYIFTVGTTAPGTSFCSGDGTGTACPCANNGIAGNGCANSLNPSGGNITATGLPSITGDSVTLQGSGMPNSSALYFQGTSQQSGGLGAPFGDGLRCAGGSVVRLSTKSNVGGGSQYPVGADLPVSVKGLVVAPGNRTYQVWYRNAAAFCTVSTFNLTNGYQIAWQP